MIFTDAKTKGIRKEFRELEKIMVGLGYDRTWDYTKAIYDLKLTTHDAEYYLRLPCKVVSAKQLEHPKAILEVDLPIFTRHFFPHGLDHEVEVPAELKEVVQMKIAEIEEALGTTISA